MLDNPVLRKEMLLRFRFRQAGPARIGGAVTGIVGIAIFYYLAFTMLVSGGARDAYDLWGMAYGVQFFLILLTAPSLAANAISQEREQQTLEMLVSTRLRPFEIVIGKLAGRMITIALLLAAFAPIIFLSGMIALSTDQGEPNGMTLTKFIMGYVVTILTAICLTSIGIYLSLKLKRTLYAIMASYVVAIGALTFGTGIVTAILNQGFGRNFGDAMNWPTLWINPVRLFIGVYELQEPLTWLSVLFGCIIYAVASCFIFFHIMNAFRRLARHD